METPARSNMFWKVNNNFVPLRMISTMEHLHRIKNLVSTKGGMWNGHSSEDWLKALDQEKSYRNRLGRNILKSLSTNKCIVLNFKKK